MASKKKSVSVVPEETPVTSLYLMDIPEVARRLSTTVFAVRTLIRTNKLKFVPVGHAQLISPAAIQAFIAASETRYSDAA